MIVSKDWIERYQTSGGGWTAKQLSILGIEWPPKKGWKDRVVGLVLDDQDARIFEELHRLQQIKNGKAQQKLDIFGGR